MTCFFRKGSQGGYHSPDSRKPTGMKKMVRNIPYLMLNITIQVRPSLHGHDISQQIIVYQPYINNIQQSDISIQLDPLRTHKNDVLPHNLYTLTFFQFFWVVQTEGRLVDMTCSSWEALGSAPMAHRTWCSIDGQPWARPNGKARLN